MGGRRQKTQLLLAFAAEGGDEFPTAVAEGTEPPAAKRESESPTQTESLMEEVCQRDNLWKALKRVQANKGAPGVDGMTVRQLPKYLKRHWPKIREQLLAGTYRPQPVKRVEIPKPDGGVRKLGIPTALDRFIQQAVQQVLAARWDGTFSKHSYGFRPGRSAHQAVAQAQAYIAEGYGFTVDMDLEKFFDRVNHDILMGRVAKRVEDERMLKLIRAFLNAGVMENGLVSPSEEGTPQGGPLSPLLSNLLLDDLDRELERRGLRFVRYADDCNIYVRSRRAGERVLRSITRFLTRKLKLKVNESKSGVARPAERKFLGFSFTRGRQPKRRLAPKTLLRFKKRIRELTKRNRGISLERMVAQLRRYLIGWRGYFGFCETPSVLRDLDSWIRRRLRCFQWKLWKRGKTRFAELRKRGVGKDLAAQTAGSSRGLWHISRSPALSIALPGAYFDSLGLPKLSESRPV
jgi:RNA-directed DNA polymerase